MAREQIRITPSLVTWARERAGLTLAEAERTFAHIAEWERGESFPTYAQLEGLAGQFRLPIAVFFFPSPPEVPAIQETFRTLPDAEFVRLPSRMRLLLRKAKALQLNLSELTQGRNPASRLITRDISFAAESSVDNIVAEVRTYLGVTIEQQTGWADEDMALKEWRRSLFDAGIFVFKDAFEIDEFSGFCLYDEVFPIIYVNNSTTKTRQIFTLFHELGHLLFRTSGVDTLNDELVDRLSGEPHQIEVLCNRFAAQFLVPGEAFSAALADEEPSEATAQNLAARFHVSRETIFRKFLDSGLIGARTYREAAAHWAAQRESGGTGGNYYWTKLAYLGREYVSLALREFRQNRIDETQLAEYLDTKPRNIGGIEQYFERGNS